MAADQRHDSDTESPQPESPRLESPGTQLRQAREAAGLDLETLARELRMTPTKVRALEADDFENLPSGTFVRGYLRAYAKRVDLEIEPLLASYQQAWHQAGLGEAEEESPLRINLPEPARPAWHFAVIILLLLAGIWLAAAWFLNGSDREGASALRDAAESPAPEGESGPARAERPEEAEESEALVESLRAAARAAEGTGTDDSESEAEPESSDDSPAATEPAESVESDTLLAAEAPASQERQALDQLHLRFADECWVEVTDSRGDVLAADLLRAGAELELQGRTPFTVKLGNAESASIELNGEAYEFVPPPGERVAILTVE